MSEKRIQKIESIIGDCETFLDRVFGNLKEAGFSADEFKELDHIAYRTETVERYEQIKNELLEFSKAHSDKPFNGRQILVCRLETPIAYKVFSIEGLEVLAPKKDNQHKEGLEHAEFVIKTTLPEFREKHHDVNFNLDAYDREDNPELIVDFENCAVKFHTQSLLEVRSL